MQSLKDGCPIGSYRKDNKCISFKDTKFKTAQEKHMILYNYRRFLGKLETEYKDVSTFRAFTKKLYLHLSSNCSFIAHYDRATFFGRYFTNPENTMNFLSQMAGCELWGDNGDLNAALRDETRRILPKLEPLMMMREKGNDIQQARMLLEKHGIKLPSTLETGKKSGDRYIMKADSEFMAMHGVKEIYDTKLHRFVETYIPPGEYYADAKIGVEGIKKQKLDTLNKIDRAIKEKRRE